WKWLTPRYSELNSAICISSLVIAASLGFVAISGCEPTDGISGLGAYCFAAKREWIPRQSMESSHTSHGENGQLEEDRRVIIRAWLDRWSCADGYSLRRHLVVIASRGDWVLAHLYESQGSAACKGSFSRFAPFQVKNNVREVDHGVLNRLVKDLRVEGCDAYGFGEACSVLEYLSELEDSLRFDHQEEGRQRVHYDELLLAEMLQGEASAL